jgi:hypothetical protein
VTTIPPPGHRHGIADLLRLVDVLRLIIHDRSLDPDDALRRARDEFRTYDHPEADD